MGGTVCAAHKLNKRKKEREEEKRKLANGIPKTYTPNESSYSLNPVNVAARDFCNNEAHYRSPHVKLYPVQNRPLYKCARNKKPYFKVGGQQLGKKRAFKKPRGCLKK